MYEYFLNKNDVLHENIQMVSLPKRLCIYSGLGDTSFSRFALSLKFYNSAY